MLDEVFFHALGHTAYDPHNKVMPLFAQGVQGIKPVVDFVFRIFSYGAGVQQHSIGLVQRFTGFIARHLHDRSDNLAVGHIHLATISLYI